jgi:DNA-binding transcriptional ArsR family regulator
MSELATTITDSRVLAAMSNPVRRRLLDVLHVDGAGTVTMLAARTGLAVGSVSHHVAVLSQASLVEPAPELARDRRESWWRAVSKSSRWSSTDFSGDPASEAVADAAASLNLAHHVDKVRSWQSRAERGDDWLNAAFATDAWLRLTPEELRAFSEQLNGLIAQWKDRSLAADDRSRELVFFFAHGVPAEP